MSIEPLNDFREVFNEGIDLLIDWPLQALVDLPDTCAIRQYKIQMEPEHQVLAPRLRDLLDETTIGTVSLPSHLPLQLPRALQFIADTDEQCMRGHLADVIEIVHLAPLPGCLLFSGVTSALLCQW